MNANFLFNLNKHSKQLREEKLTILLLQNWQLNDKKCMMYSNFIFSHDLCSAALQHDSDLWKITFSCVVEKLAMVGIHTIFNVNL